MEDCNKKNINLICFALTTNTFRFFVGDKTRKKSIIKMCKLLFCLLKNNNFKYEIYNYLKIKINIWSSQLKMYPKITKKNINRRSKRVRTKWIQIKKNKKKEMLNDFKNHVNNNTKVFLDKLLKQIQRTVQNNYYCEAQKIIRLSKIKYGNQNCFKTNDAQDNQNWFKTQDAQDNQNWFKTQDAQDTLDKFVDSL